MRVYVIDTVISHPKFQTNFGQSIISKVRYDSAIQCTVTGRAVRVETVNRIIYASIEYRIK